MKAVGATVLTGLWAVEWAWHSTKSGEQEAQESADKSQ